jgi:hypothetical protein
MACNKGIRVSTFAPLLHCDVVMLNHLAASYIADGQRVQDHMFRVDSHNTRSYGDK